LSILSPPLLPTKELKKWDRETEDMVETYKAKKAKPDDTRFWAEAKKSMLNHITNFTAQNR
jgi:hypothetical protein